MELTPKTLDFVKENSFAVLSALRKNGAAQLSVVNTDPFRDGVAFTTPNGRAKLNNLRRDPQCSLLVSQNDWRGYVVLEGRATIMDAENTNADELRDAFREVFRVASHSEHPNWPEYDQAMIDDNRAIVIVVPDHVYGTAV